MWIWLAVIVGFFSIPWSELIGYVLPALPPLAYLVAIALRQKWGNSETLPRPFKSFAAVAGVVCVSAILANNVFNTKSDRSLANLIASQRQPGEPIVFLKNQFFDMPFYLRLREPVRIFDDWDQANVPQRDNWRKALYDAGRFDQPKARDVLLDHAQLTQALCAHSASWIVGLKGSDREYPFLQQTRPVSTQEYARVWKVSQTAMAA